MLVWYEHYELMIDAIAREKQIKAGSRKAKLKLIEQMNLHWVDLYGDLAHDG
jgi:predicted GIY-YIG superfamily endonuclease